MVMTVNMHEAKTNFSKLAKLVEQGEEVLIARDGKVFMKLVAAAEELKEPRDLSKLRGLASGLETQEEWDALDKEILDAIVYSDDDF
uniref:type II toxin-antitoxin system Phd/YefM family antitoxin n=1 Tax=Aquiluna sp. TaxID=2053504 RepID=UPI0040488068